MKVFISADIEGIAGITSWDEANPDHPDYPPFRKRMTQHVKAACEGAIAAGATEIVVKDAHWHGRNIAPEQLPDCVRVHRGWSGDPMFMVEGLDETFDAIGFVGYHSMSGSGGNPLAHTLSSNKIFRMSINDQPVSEFHIHAWAAGLCNVPTVFFSGDTEMCREVLAMSPETVVVSAMTGFGATTLSEHPSVNADAIRAGMERGLSQRSTTMVLRPRGPFSLSITYHKPTVAYRKGFYPGAQLVEANTVRFDAIEYYEVLRALVFLVE